jgi:hypothetical protein
LKHGLSPKYVLDEMETYEINAILKYGYYREMDGWEQARLNAYMTAQVNSKKRLKFDDICKFYWEEEEEKEKHTKTISEEDIKRLRNKAQNYLKKING